MNQLTQFRMRGANHMGKFVIRHTAAGVKFDLKAANGEVIASSGVYAAESACRKGIQSVIRNCTGAVEDQTGENYTVLRHPKFQVSVPAVHR